MRLSAYLSTNKLTHAAFAEQAGVTAEAVRLWAHGRAIPTKGPMRKILELTEGEVQPNDFYLEPAA